MIGSIVELLLLSIPVLIAMMGYVFASKYVRRTQRTYLQTETGMCAACSYDLAGLACDAVCPECGSSARKQKYTRMKSRPHAWWYPFDRTSSFDRLCVYCIVGHLTVCVGVRMMSESIHGNSFFPPPEEVVVLVTALLVSLAPLIVAARSISRAASHRHFVWLIAGTLVMMLVGGCVTMAELTLVERVIALAVLSALVSWVPLVLCIDAPAQQFVPVDTIDRPTVSDDELERPPRSLGDSLVVFALFSLVVNSMALLALVSGSSSAMR